MNTGEISRKIKTIVAEVANLDPREIADDATLDRDLVLDSLAIITIAAAIEEEFQLAPLEIRWHGVRSVSDAVELVAGSRP